MTKKLRLILIFSFLIFGYGALFAQQPEQDCINAIPVCQNVYVQTNSYTDEGNDPNEIDPLISCLGSGEENDVWYIFTVQTPGMLNFTINPIDNTDDYDWAVYDITNSSCADIANNPLLEVSCNYSATSGATGPNYPTGANSNGAGGPNRNAPIPVNQGQTFVVNVSNFSGTTSGYTLDFTASTAAIFDNIPPEMDSLSANCGGGVEVFFSENIVCSTVEPSDFLVTGPGGPYTVTSVAGNNCTAGGTFESSYVINVTPLMVTGGKYYVSLQGDVEDNCGNIGIYSTDSLDIVIPNITATASQTTLCQGESTTLSTPTQAGFNYVWSGGNAGATVTVTPPLSAVYTVFATDPFGCTSTGSVPITVIDTADATFTSSQTNVCPNDVVDITFTGTSDPGATFVWDFAGATIISGTGAGPYQISWPTAGTKPISLVITQQGCSSSSSTTNISVSNVPSSDFSVPANPVCISNTATITYTGTPSPTATYFWDFDGGIVMAGAGIGPYQVSWATPGPKNISLNVTDNACVSPTTQKALTVAPNPAAAITPVADQCFKGNNFSFSYNGGGQISSYDWDFGDGSASSADPAPSHSYTSSGNYVTTLTLTDANGCSNSGSVNLEVYPILQADFSNTSVCSGQITGFTDLSNSNGIALQDWIWDFGNGSLSTFQNPSETFTDFGVFNTRLIVSTVQGCADTVTKQIEVFEQPTADFTFVEACENLPVKFQETSQVNSTTLIYSWDFGDGQRSTDRNPEHIYAGFGSFPITLTVRTPQGCSDAANDNINVFPKPTANLQVPAVCHKSRSVFTSLSTIPGGGNIDAYQWNFGNGASSTDQEPAYRYDQPGLYDVTLIVSSNNNCLDTATISATIYPNPVPAFSATPVCETDEASFSNLSTIDGSITADIIDRFEWDFGDNSALSSLEHPTHTFGEDGNYNITLTATSNKGCQASIISPLLIYANPMAPNALEDTACFGFSAFLIAQPQPGQEVDHVDWFSQATGGSEFETSFTYVTPPLTSTQTYYLEAVSSFGCRSPRVEINAYTHDENIGNLVAMDTVLEIPQAIGEFAIIGGSPIASYEWNFGDGNTSTNPQPVHEYKYPGKYRVTVNYITENGCEGEFSKLIEVK